MIIAHNGENSMIVSAVLINALEKRTWPTVGFELVGYSKNAVDNSIKRRNQGINYRNRRFVNIYHLATHYKIPFPVALARFELGWEFDKLIKKRWLGKR